MIAIIGFGILIISLVISVFAVATAIFGVLSKSSIMVETSRRAALIVFPLLSLTVGAMLFLLCTGQFEYVSVYQTTSVSMPLYLKITALWGGQEGSLLFWCWLLSGYTFLALIKKQNKNQDLIPWVIVVLGFTLAFFIFLVTFLENPFNRYFVNLSGEVVKSLFPPVLTIQAHPADGLGLNPLLRHFGMVVHPPMLYLGFVGFAIPFAYALAALVRGRTDDEWIRSTRKWSLTAWLFLTLGLVLGSRWAYDVLGWGGYWGWDPVEIAALLPWLISTAYLHSMVMQEKRQLFKHWNIALIILTFCTVILGTFLTRSGMLSSVHAFSESAIGPAFFIFISLVFIISLGLLIYRWTSLNSPYEIKSFFSREAAFLFNNLLFLAIFLICLIGMLFPIFSELITGQTVTVGPPFYKSATGPLFALLLLLMGIVPLTAWGSSSVKRLGKQIWKPALLSLISPIAALFIIGKNVLGLIGIWLVFLAILVTVFDTAKSINVRTKNNHESWLKSLIHLTSHNRRRYGGYIIHLGVALMGLGIIGIELFQTQTQTLVKAGESINISGYSVTYERLDIEKTVDGREMAKAVMHISKGDKDLGWLYPRRDYYYDADQTVTVPGLRSTLTDDLYIILVDWLPISSDGATFKVFHNPLVIWLWIGTFILILGTIIALWPGERKSQLAAEITVIE